MIDFCMGFIVCVDVGEFDVYVLEFKTECGAKKYKDLAQPHSNIELLIKPATEMRFPKTEFMSDEICVRFET